MKISLDRRFVSILSFAFLAISLSSFALAACATYPKHEVGPITTAEKRDFDSLWNYGNPAASEQAFRALLPEADELGDVAYKAELMTQIARAEGLQRKFVEAHKTLDEVEKMLKPDMYKENTRYLLERGRVYNSAGDTEKAIPLLKKAFDESRRKCFDYYAVDSAHMLGIAYKGEDSMQWNLKALDIAEGSNEPEARNWLGSLYNNIGWTHFDAGRHQQALEIFEKALKLRKEKGDKEAILIARWSVARALRELGRIDEAYKIQYALLQELEEAGKKDGYVLEELGEIALVNDNPEQAKKYFATAYEELSKDPQIKAGQPKRLLRLKRLAGME